MYISNKIIFLELHKTASSHILSILEQILEGRTSGKHNRIHKKYLDKFIIGSIRNPWDWYVSLWAYGCKQKGSIYNHVTGKFGLPYLYINLPNEMGKPFLTPRELFIQIKNDCNTPKSIWTELYSDPNDPKLFRRWLKYIFNPKHSFDLGEGYGFSPISNNFGIYTYRYFKLFTNLNAQIYKNKALSTSTGLNSAWENHSIMNFLIRKENLEDDLIQALEKAGLELKESDTDFIYNSRKNKTNTSNRKTYQYYYDDDSVQLVYEKESFIINKHSYQY